MKTLYILAALLAVSLCANGILAGLLIPSQQAMIAQLVGRTNDLGTENMQLQRQLDQENLTLQTYASQLRFYRGGGTQSPPSTTVPAAYILGGASMEAPAVSQQIVQQQRNGFVTQTVVQNGSMMNISVEIRPGSGRILVQTTPLMGIVFQDAANTAVHIARNETDADISASDVIFSIEAEHQISSVDGPSAGALMTLLTIAALRHQEIDHNLTLTGTIEEDGHIGAIGGVVEKATAAKASGKTTFLLPRDNSIIVQYSEKTVNYGGFLLVERVPERVSAQDYLEKTVGIRVIYVDTIEDVLAAAIH